MTTNKIGANWMIRMDDNCVPNKSSHSPACDMRGLMSNGSVGDLLWFITKNKGRIVAVATFASAPPTEVSYTKFYDLSDCDFHPAIPTLNETVSSYYEQIMGCVCGIRADTEKLQSKKIEYHKTTR